LTNSTLAPTLAESGPVAKSRRKPGWVRAIPEAVGRLSRKTLESYSMRSLRKVVIRSPGAMKSRFQG
jgi:hypothetical protein